MSWRPSASLDGLRLLAALRRGVRAWMAERDVLEVTTPVLSGAASSELHLDAFRAAGPSGGPISWLQTSPEYPMKRLLAAHGVDVYQIAPVFRDGERGRCHNPEFTMLEWYRVGMDHVALMDDVEALLATLWPIGERTWHPPERRACHDLVDAILGEGAAAREAGETGRARNGAPVDATGFDGARTNRVRTSEATFVDAERIRAHFEREERSFPASIGDDADAAFDLFMDEFVLPTLPPDRPTFIHGWPPSRASLARIGRDGEGRLVAERFELYVGTLEIGNGFHELADAAEQRRRFEHDLARRRALGRETPPLDERLLEALGTGLPDCAGVAIGIERLAMAIGGLARIDDALAFGVERA